MHNTKCKVAEPHRENKAFHIFKSRCFTVKKISEYLSNWKDLFSKITEINNLNFIISKIRLTNQI